MTSWQAAQGAHRGERFSNWLALLALIACGIPWLPADTGAPVAPAGSLVARSAGRSRPVILRSAIVPVARLALRQSFTK